MGNEFSISGNHKGHLEDISKLILAKKPTKDIITQIEHHLGKNCSKVPGWANAEQYANIHPLHLAIQHDLPFELVEYLASGSSRLTPIVGKLRTKEINQLDTLDAFTNRAEPPGNGPQILKLLLQRIPVEVEMHYYSQILINLLTAPTNITAISNQMIEVFFRHVHMRMLYHPNSRSLVDKYIPFEFDFLQYPNVRYFVGFSFVNPYQYLVDPHFKRKDSPEFRALIKLLHRCWMGWNPLYFVYLEKKIQDHFTHGAYLRRYWRHFLIQNCRVSGSLHHWFSPPQPIDLSYDANSSIYASRLFLRQAETYALATNWDYYMYPPSDIKYGDSDNLHYTASHTYPIRKLHSRSDLSYGVFRTDGTIRQVPFSLYGPDLPANVLFNNNNIFSSELFNWILEDLSQLHFEQYQRGTYIFHPWTEIVKSWTQSNPDETSIFLPPGTDTGIVSNTSSGVNKTFVPLVPHNEKKMNLFVYNTHENHVDMSSIWRLYYQEANAEPTNREVESAFMQSGSEYDPDTISWAAFGELVNRVFMYTFSTRPPTGYLPPNARVNKGGPKYLKLSDFQEEIRKMFVSLVPSPVFPETSSQLRNQYRESITIRNLSLPLLQNEQQHFVKTYTQRWTSAYYLELSKTIRALSYFKQKHDYPTQPAQLLQTIRSHLNTILNDGELISKNLTMVKHAFTVYSLRYISRALYLLQQPNFPLIADPAMAVNTLSTSSLPYTHWFGCDYLYSPPSDQNEVLWYKFSKFEGNFSTSPIYGQMTLPFMSHEIDRKDPDFALFSTLDRLFPFTPQPVFPLLATLTQICSEPSLLLTDPTLFDFFDEFYSRMVDNVTQSSKSINLTAYEDPDKMIGKGGKYSIPILANLTKSDFAITARYLQNGFSHPIHLTYDQAHRLAGGEYTNSANKITGDYFGTGENTPYRLVSDAAFPPIVDDAIDKRNTDYSHEAPIIPQSAEILGAVPNTYSRKLLNRHTFPNTIPPQHSWERIGLIAKFPIENSKFVSDSQLSPGRFSTHHRTLAGGTFCHPIDSNRSFSETFITQPRLGFQKQKPAEPFVIQPILAPGLDLLDPIYNRNVNYWNEEWLRFPPLLARLWCTFNSANLYFDNNLLLELISQLSVGKKLPTLHPASYVSQSDNNSGRLMAPSSREPLDPQYDPVNFYVAQAAIGGMSIPVNPDHNSEWAMNDYSEKSKSKSEIKSATNLRTQYEIQTKLDKEKAELAKKLADQAANGSLKAFLQISSPSNANLSVFDPRISVEWLKRVYTGSKMIQISRLVLRSGLGSVYSLTPLQPGLGFRTPFSLWPNSLYQVSSRRQNMPGPINIYLTANVNPFALPYFSTFKLYNIDYSSQLKSSHSMTFHPQPEDVQGLLQLHRLYTNWWNGEHDAYQIDFENRTKAVSSGDIDGMTKLKPSNTVQISNIYHQGQPLSLLMDAYINSIHLFPNVIEVANEGVMSVVNYNDIEEITTFSHCFNPFGDEISPEQREIERNDTRKDRFSAVYDPTGSTSAVTTPSYNHSLNDSVSQSSSVVTTLDLPDFNSEFGLSILDKKRKLSLPIVPVLDFILSSLHDQISFLFSTGQFWVNYQFPWFSGWNTREVLSLPVAPTRTAHEKLLCIKLTPENSYLTFDDYIANHQIRMLNIYHLVSNSLYQHHLKLTNQLDLPKLIMQSDDKAPIEADVDPYELTVTLPKHISSSRVLPPPQTLPESLLRMMDGYMMRAPRMAHNSFSLNLVSALYDIADAFIAKHQNQSLQTHEYYRVITHADPTSALSLAPTEKHGLTPLAQMAATARRKKKPAAAKLARVLAALTAKTSASSAAVPSTSEPSDASGSDDDGSDDDDTVAVKVAVPIAPTPTTTTTTTTTTPATPTSTIETPEALEGVRATVIRHIPILTNRDYAEYYIAWLVYQPFCYNDLILDDPLRQIKSIGRPVTLDDEKTFGVFPKLDPNVAVVPIYTPPKAIYPESEEPVVDKITPINDYSTRGYSRHDISTYNKSESKSPKERPDEQKDALIATNFNFLFNLLNTNAIERLEYRSARHNLSIDNFVIDIARQQVTTSSELRRCLEREQMEDLVNIDNNIQTVMSEQGVDYDEALYIVDSQRLLDLFEATGPELPTRYSNFPTIRECMSIIDTYITTVVYNLFPQIASHPQYTLPQKGLLWFLDLIHKPSLDDVLPLVNGLTIETENEYPELQRYTPLSVSMPGFPFGYSIPTEDVVFSMELLSSETMDSQEARLTERMDQTQQKTGDGSSFVLIEPILSIFDPINPLETSNLVLHPDLISPRPDVPQPVLETPITYGQTLFMQFILRRHSSEILAALINIVGIDNILQYRNHHYVSPMIRGDTPNKFSVFDWMEVARTFTYAPEIVKKLETAIQP
jgi:hypothetical protein